MKTEIERIAQDVAHNHGIDDDFDGLKAKEMRLKTLKHTVEHEIRMLEYLKGGDER